MVVEKILKSVWDEFVYGGHLLSLGSISAIFTSAILLNINITLDLLVIVYLITYIIYLYNRFKEFEKDSLTNFKRTQHLTKYIQYTPLIVICLTFIIIIMLFYFSNLKGLIFGLLILFMGLLYSLLFKEITKQIIGFKNFYVAFVWSLLVIFLFIYYSLSINLSIFFIFIFIFIRCFIDTSFYDIKDIESDKKENLLTLAIVLKKEKLIEFLNVINILALIPIFLGVYLQLLPIFSLMLFFTIPITFYFFKKIENDQIDTAYLSEIAIGIEKNSWVLLVLLGKFLL